MKKKGYRKTKKQTRRKEEKEKRGKFRGRMSRR